MIRRGVKAGGFVALAAAVLGAVALGFSAAESRYECDADIFRGDPEPSSSTMLRLTLSDYRWSKRLVTGSDGALRIESPADFATLYSNLRAEAEYQGTHWYIHGDGERDSGGFSTGDGLFAVETPRGLISAQCRAALRGNPE